MVFKALEQPSPHRWQLEAMTVPFRKV